MELHKNVFVDFEKFFCFLKMMLNWSLSSSQWIMIFVSRDNILEDDLNFLTNDRSLFFASLELYDLHTKYPFHDFKKAHSAVCVVPYHILPQKVLEYIYEIVGKAYFPLFIRTKIYNSPFYNTSSQSKSLKNVFLMMYCFSVI